MKYLISSISGLRAAISPYRRSVGRVFQSRQSVSAIKQLMSVPSIIELDRLAPEQACVVSYNLMVRLREQLRVDPAPPQARPCPLLRPFDRARPEGVALHMPANHKKTPVFACLCVAGRQTGEPLF
jgi:hypothetical protein